MVEVETSKWLWERVGGSYLYLPGAHPLCNPSYYGQCNDGFLFIVTPIQTRPDIDHQNGSPETA